MKAKTDTRLFDAYAEGTIGSFFTKINNEVEKQMNDDLKNWY